ncbi:hypothetical protein MANES_09G174950v8 [Manihot esculenta]|uniref:Uncharacterized protein n=1 Tax=Manihot esculenta TaxID=3983 RepID=A0ACB7H7T3_MANES|nr:hypothetical protein MANES_09G174950v8 [Manihot esculenta]
MVGEGRMQQKKHFWGGCHGDDRGTAFSPQTLTTYCLLLRREERISTLYGSSFDEHSQPPTWIQSNPCQILSALNQMPYSFLGLCVHTFLFLFGPSMHYL